MASKQWAAMFKVGNVLRTAFRNRRFKIGEFTRTAIRVVPLDRKKQAPVSLTYSRLNKLASAVEEVERRVGEGERLTKVVNEVWARGPARLASEHQNESQYWAMVLELRVRGAPDPTSSALEGRRSEYTLSKVERDPVLRRKCIERNGARCAACGFDFLKSYGEIGRGYIQVHHVKPLSGGLRRTSVDDLIPMCANCHVIVHRRTPPFSVKQVRKLLKSLR